MPDSVENETLDLIVLGAGGHGRVLLDAVALQHPAWTLAVLDPNPSLHGTPVLGWPILGDDELLEEIARINPGLRFAVGVGAIRSSPHRRRLFEYAVSRSVLPHTLVHPAAFVSAHATLGAGAQVMAGAVLQTQAVVRANALINTRAVVEHDCVVGAHAHVASGAVLSGDVEVGEGALIGAGAVVRQGIRIGAGAVVGAGAAVIRDVPDGATVVGCPARPVGENS